MHEKVVFQSVMQVARKTKSEYCQRESNLRSTKKRLNFVVDFVFFCTENLDRDQRRNLFAQEQSKKVQQLRIILYWR